MNFEFTKTEHDLAVSTMTGQPPFHDVMNDACEAVQELLVKHHGWGKNVMVHGLLMQQLWNVYCAGERRGIARANDPFSALFPLPKTDEPVSKIVAANQPAHEQPEPGNHE